MALEKKQVKVVIRGCDGNNMNEMKNTIWINTERNMLLNLASMSNSTTKLFYSAT